MHHPSLVRNPGELDVATFFGDFCRKTLVVHKAHLPGRVAFFLSGERGGTWVIDLAKRQVQIGVPDRMVDLVCAMSVEQFERMIRGQLDSGAALAKKEIELAGNVSLLSTLSELFAPTK